MAQASAASVPAYLLPGVQVIQPPNLEGDATLATEILPGPPSITSIRQPKKIDARKPHTIPLSYLPLSDPGTTYSGLAGGIMPLQDSGSRRKRARVDRVPSNRAERASARRLTNPTVPLATMDYDDSMGAQDVPLDTAPFFDSSGVELNRNQHLTIPDHISGTPELVGNGDVVVVPPPAVAPSAPTNGRRTRRTRDKGKGKERMQEEEIRIKEEPVAVAIPDLPLVPAAALPNQDHCSACSSVGSLVFCDGCPRAFHLWCLNPPMDAANIPEGDRWYCPKCKIDKMPKKRNPSSFLSPVLDHLDRSAPSEFRLPDDIKTCFKDVGSDIRGGYVDTTYLKPPRLGRHGFGEERDPYRLKDGRGSVILCFKCRTSAISGDDVASSSTPTPIASKRPRRASAVASTTEHWKPIVSCDYCSLHWHLDCLDPPLIHLPPLHKKWKCPNHASNVLPKRRILKNNNAPPIDITVPNQFNNGNIEIISTDPPGSSYDRLQIEELMINGRRYRIPERVILLDFWNKVEQKNRGRTSPQFIPSRASSPLTSLSSLEDGEDDEVAVIRPSRHIADNDDLQVAELLCDLQYSAGRRPMRAPRRLKDQSVQASPQDSLSQTEPIKATRSSAPRVSAAETSKRSSRLREPRKSSVVNPPPESAPPVNGRNPRASRTSTRQAALAANAALAAAAASDALFDSNHSPLPPAEQRRQQNPLASTQLLVPKIEQAEIKTPSLKIRIPPSSTLKSSPSHGQAQLPPSPSSSTTQAHVTNTPSRPIRASRSSMGTLAASAVTGKEAPSYQTRRRSRNFVSKGAGDIDFLQRTPSSVPS